MIAQFIVSVTVQVPDGTVAAAQIQQGNGEAFVKEYLQKKMPAGSILAISRVVEIAHLSDPVDS